MKVEMELPSVTVSRQISDIEFIHLQFKCQPDPSMKAHYESILISLCTRIIDSQEYQKMIKQEAIYAEQLKNINEKIIQIKKDLIRYGT